MHLNDSVMDTLYFKTKSKEGVLSELGVPTDAPSIYDSRNGWVLHWVGKLPKSTTYEKDEEGNDVPVIEWHEDFFFNIYLRGQENMNYFTKSFKAGQLINPEPNTPIIKLL